MSNTRQEDDRFNLSGKNPKFFKIIIQDTLLEGRLGIPKKFIKKHGDCLSRCLIFKVRDGMEWKMELGNDSNEVWLQKGWKEFSAYYSLKHGYLLVFKYEIKSNFLVFIFDTTLMEIAYPAKPNVDPNSKQTPNQLNEVIEIEDTDAETETTDELQVKSYELKGLRNCRGLKAAEKFSSSKPWFKVVLKQKLSVLNIPIGFMRDHMEGHETVTLKAEGVKRCWPVKLNFFGQRSSARLATGWVAFVKDNRLKLKDVCVFELVRSNTLKVYQQRICSSLATYP